MQPAIGKNFTFKLTTAPSGIAQRQNAAFGTFAQGDLFEDINRCSYRDTRINMQGSLV